MQRVSVALANVVDSRADFRAVRRPLLEGERSRLDWLRQEFDLFESGDIGSAAEAEAYARAALAQGVEALVIFIPVWADPVFAVQIARQLGRPTLLLGNTRPETSSIVGMLGAGGALDQVGIAHRRIFDYEGEAGQASVRAFLHAAGALARLRGQTLGLFGGPSLGILTAGADPVQAQKLFGVDIQFTDQLEIRQVAETLPAEEAQRHLDWLVSRVAEVRYGGLFTPASLEKQMRSYLATRQLVSRHGFDFVGVKCQPEMSDGYVSQCVAHMLSNGELDADGEKAAVVHACESDADGALTMQILHLLSGGKPAALLDVRWYDARSGTWILANCGAIPAALCATPDDRSGLAQMRIEPHVFGKGGGGALPALVAPQLVTLARLCRRDGQYWMAVLPAVAEQARPEELNQVTPPFPKAVVRLAAGLDFLEEFGSNHVHLVSGEYREELIAFCELAGIPARVWQ
jgi:L-fucose isomerase